MIKSIFKKTLIFLISFLFISNTLFSQEFLPFLNDNYAGITAINLNPASIADSRLKVDVTVFGFSTNFTNNYLKVDRKVLSDVWSDKIDGNFKSSYMTENLNNKDKKMIMTNQVQGLSCMVSLSEKHSVGLSLRVRNVINLDRLDENMAKMIYEDFDYNPFFTQRFNVNDVSFQQNAWAEVGLTYARVLFENDHEHFFKFGGTVKVIQGLGSIFMYINEVKYQFDAKDTLMYLSADLSMGASKNYEEEFLNLSSTSNLTLGLDLGAVYEWRPDHSKYKYDMDGERDLWRRDQNKYKVRLGFSILDLGRIKYERGQNSADIKAYDVTNWNMDSLNVTADNFGEFLVDSFRTESVDKYFKMNLPTVISAQIDYNVRDHFYLNFTPFISLRQGKSDMEKIHYLSNFSLTPRYESKWLGASVPLQLNQMGQFNFGLGLRLGPVWVGSYDLLGAMGLKKKVAGLDVHFLVKVPIFYKKPKDRDKDNVSDKVDECKDTPGLWEFKGCPDSDNDGIPNKDDKCPYKAGIKEFGGCPDTDKDGVEDQYDECPELYGSKLYAGCPDTDEDGIIDKKDDCPEEAGLEIFNGCPDTDGDSIMDKLDDCPEIAGLEKFKGCPDTDGDGIRDIEDECPDVAGLDSLNGCPFIDTDLDGLQDKYDHCPKLAGPLENSGCPFVDTDNDGVLDKDDWCPMTPGVVENNGCPVLEEEEQEILNTAFENLEFTSGKSIIKSSSFASLDELAELFMKKPEWQLLIEGHTDNVGRPASNMSLSQNRANAVKTYLISKGVKAETMTVKWYGETKPIADNETPEGRQKNRRVEMTVIFD
ncbi:MAG: DUF5723 family protein [Saprospiraceae bacterium]|nr:DUF5723 family protein [Saprospiraceae bacterium]